MDPERVMTMQVVMPRAWRDVLIERRRQVEVNGYDAVRDDSYPDEELEKVSSCFALQHTTAGVFFPGSFPWGQHYHDKMRENNHRRNLVIAAALLLAAIERLDRKE
jgi:hypothetical protein